MAKNKIQFQKGISIQKFMEQYGTEDQCREALFQLRWPQGFSCLQCGNTTYCSLKTRELFQCNQCHYQISVTAGTIFHGTHLPLTKWFLGIFLLTQNKNGISALELSRQVCISYDSAWRLKHKLMQVMLERDTKKKLHNRVEIDDSVLGGKRKAGNRGREPGVKHLFLRR